MAMDRLAGIQAYCLGNHLGGAHKVTLKNVTDQVEAITTTIGVMPA